MASGPVTTRRKMMRSGAGITDEAGTGGCRRPVQYMYIDPINIYIYIHIYIYEYIERI